MKLKQRIIMNSYTIPKSQLWMLKWNKPWIFNWFLCLVSLSIRVQRKINKQNVILRRDHMQPFLKAYPQKTLYETTSHVPLFEFTSEVEESPWIRFPYLHQTLKKSLPFIYLLSPQTKPFLMSWFWIANDPPPPRTVHRPPIYWNMSKKQLVSWSLFSHTFFWYIFISIQFSTYFRLFLWFSFLIFYIFSIISTIPLLLILIRFAIDLFYGPAFHFEFFLCFRSV